MKWCTRLLGTLLVALMSLMAATSDAGAQVPGQPTFDVSQLPGLQEAVTRVYTGDLAALYLGPDGTQPTSGAAFFSVSATVAKFDSTAHAAAALGKIESQYTGGNQSVDAFHIKKMKIAPIGDGAFAYAGAAKLGDLNGTLGIVVAHNGRYIQTATGFAMGEDPVPQLAELVTTMIALKEGGTVSTSSDGLHTGGLWNMVPLDSGVPGGVKANMDIQVYPTTKN